MAKSIIDVKAPAMLCPWSLAMGFGVMWALCVLILSFKDNKDEQLVHILRELYFDANPKTNLGKFVLTLSALLNGFVCGLVLGWVYNASVSAKS